MDCVEYIKSDLYRYTGSFSFGSFVIQYVRNRSFRYSFWLRLCRSRNGMIKLIAMIMHKWYSGKYLIKIPRQTRIGYGRYIGHNMCIVISDTAVIGDNCNLGQFLTIGSNHGKAATIGDCVYIGRMFVLWKISLLGAVPQ
jgi:serine O-acetyltransferase